VIPDLLILLRVGVDDVGLHTEYEVLVLRRYHLTGCKEVSVVGDCTLYARLLYVLKVLR
jgi:hypothetical protein